MKTASVLLSPFAQSQVVSVVCCWRILVPKRSLLSPFQFGIIVTTFNRMFARLGTDYEIRNQWFLAILEAMATD